jgi:hypothetical protein
MCVFVIIFYAIVDSITYAQHLCDNVTCGRSVVFCGYSSKNKKTGRPNITEIILKVASITITLTPIAYVIKISRIFAE